MAKRIGKYKVTKREETLSAVDGATIEGNLSNIGNSVNVAKDFIFNHQKNNFTTKI